MGDFYNRGGGSLVLTDLEVDGTTIVVDETNDRVGIGTAAPGTQLQVESNAPYVTLKNDTAENSAAGCESKIIFEDHGNNALGQLEVSHVGTADDEKGQLILSTNNDSGLQTALTISEAQLATFAGSVAVTVDLAVDGVANLDNTDIDGTFTMDGATFDVNATGAVTVDGTTLSLDGTDSTNLTMTANSSSAKALTIDAVNSGSGVASITLGTTSGTAVSIGHTTSETTVNDNLTVTGDLTVNGTTTTINSTTLTVDDLLIEVASGAADSNAANGAGISIDGAGATITYAHTGTKFVMNKPLDVTGAITATSDMSIAASKAYKVGSTAILSDSSGTMTLSNIDALDATTEATIEAAIDTLSNLTTVGTIATGVWNGTVIAEAYLPNAGAAAQGVVELATIAETNTGTDAARAVTPDGLNDWTGGAGAITKLGTVATGVWNGTAIASAYLDADTSHLSGAQTFTGTKTLNSFKGTGAVTVTDILDEDNMATDSATVLATQQSIKAYADTKSPVAGHSSIITVGTIGTGTWQGTAIAQAYIAGDAINGDKIADDAVDSEHYTDGSIDTDHIADNQVTLAKMAGIARGKIIYGDASGNPAVLAVGTANQVLTTDGTDVAWAAAGGTPADDSNLIFHMQVFS
jgi:hypothetical protein